MPSPVVVASNRGPVSFAVDDAGHLTLKRGGGGLVSGLRSVLNNGTATWVCAALSDADRQAVSAAPSGRLDDAGYDTGGAAVRMLDIDPLVFQRAYNGIANGTLWFVAHHMYDGAHAPTYDVGWGRLWRAYQQYNSAFALALVEEAAPGASVAVQDYHLFLAPRLLRDARPDVRISHFTHTPWPHPHVFTSQLPDDVAEELLVGLLGCDAVSFQTPRDAEDFIRCCTEVLGAKAAGETVEHNGRTTRVRVHPIGVDGDELRERAAERDVAARSALLRRWAGDRQVILRIDRTELSKNIVRGLQAYRELLRSHPEHHGRVAHLAFAYPSRHDLPEYREYTGAVQRVAAEINDELATPGWQPVRLEVSDDYARSLAALEMADVLLVNPVRDGMNLVAKEGPVLSRDGLALVLSREAGAAHELAADAIMINPFDVSQTAEALHRALLMDPAERRKRTATLAAKATAHPPSRWFADQLADLA